jgi:hypothetical protein
MLLLLKITQISKQQLNIILIIFHLGHDWAWSVRTQPISMANPVKTHLLVIRSTWFHLVLFSRSRRRTSSPLAHGTGGAVCRCLSQIYPYSKLEVGMELWVAATLEPRAPAPHAILPRHRPWQRRTI